MHPDHRNKIKISISINCLHMQKQGIHNMHDILSNDLYTLNIFHHKSQLHDFV